MSQKKKTCFLLLFLSLGGPFSYISAFFSGRALSAKGGGPSDSRMPKERKTKKGSPEESMEKKTRVLSKAYKGSPVKKLQKGAP